MAWDYLTIQGSSVPSEQAFSSGGLTGTSLHNHLSLAIFKALQILKSAYRNGHINAAQEAKGHIQQYLEALAVLEDEEDNLKTDKCWDSGMHAVGLFSIPVSCALTPLSID